MTDGSRENKASSPVYFICSHQARLELLLFDELFKGLAENPSNIEEKDSLGGEKYIKKTRFKNGAILKVTISNRVPSYPDGKMLAQHQFTAELIEEGHCSDDDKKHYWVNRHAAGRPVKDIIFDDQWGRFEPKQIYTSYTVDLTGTYYFMRHGIGTHNDQSDIGKAFSGSEYDSPLTPDGKLLMQKTGAKLKE